MLLSQPSWQYFCYLDRRTASTWPVWSTWPDIRRPASWSVACLALSAAWGDLPVSRGGHQVTSIYCGASSGRGQCHCGRGRCKIVVTGAVLKIARARMCLGRPTLVSGLLPSSTGNAGGSLIRSVWFSIVWTCSKSLLATWEFEIVWTGWASSRTSVDRRSLVNGGQQDALESSPL